MQMGSENLSDSSSFAKDEVPVEEQSDAKTWRDGTREKAAVIKRIAVDMLRSYRTSAVKTLENMTGRPMTAVSKRKARLSVAHSPTFDYRITRTVSVKEAVRSMVSEIESFVDAGHVEDAVEEPVFEITEPEAVQEVHVEAVQLISAPKEVPMLAEAKPVAEDIADELRLRRRVALLLREAAADEIVH